MFLVWSVAFGSGCATVEPIHRPPNSAELDRVNAEAGSLVVDRLPGAAGPTPQIDRVASADAAKVELVPHNGPPLTLRLDEIAGFSAHRAGRGAAIGVGVGLGVVAFETLGLLAFGALLGGASSDPGAPHSSGCDTKCTDFLVGTTLLSVGIGAIVGAIVGSPHHFPLNLGPPSNP